MVEDRSPPTLAFPSRDEWEAWLAAHHETENGVWLKLAKKGSGLTSVARPDALEVALCYGWIDGQARRLDDSWWVQRLTPRRSRSRWSKINRAKAMELIERGEMKPAGLREVERAKADGRWDAAFESLDSRNRYAILHRIEEAKRPDTRARRIAKSVAMLSEQKTLYD